MSSQLQPFVHELTTLVAAPTQVLSAFSGDIVASQPGPGAQGIIHSDVRVISELRTIVDGHSAEHLATTYALEPADPHGTGAGPDSPEVSFTGVLRQLGADLMLVPDPQVRLDRRRRVAPGEVYEELLVSSVLPHAVDLTVLVVLRSDFAPIEAIREGAGSQPVPMNAVLDGSRATWGSGTTSLTLTAADATLTQPDVETLALRWSVTVEARGRVTLGWTLRIADVGGVVVAASTAGLPVGAIMHETSRSVAAAGVVEPRLAAWLERSLRDLNGLRMSTAEEPTDAFFAAGSPWYLTLFGRDALWTSRLLLPVDVDQAAGTLRTLARLAGRRDDPESAEAPGKILHELRREQFSFGTISLPPRYYGTIDATPLWVCLLHDAWRAGLDPDAVAGLLPALEAALQWLVTAVAESEDGFLRYVDASGHGLANQGWKDSGDSIRFADGTIAEGPVALCEVQGYAYEAAVSGAALLEAFDRPGATDFRTFADALADRFRAAFWCGTAEGRYPALALDGRQRRVDSLTSNIGHLLGTGILRPDEERLVAARVSGADLDSGLGLRTMSAADGGYSPLSYHCGSVWPHDTAVVIAGLVRAGLGAQAAGLVEGLLEASVAFAQRLPELWSGEGLPVPYPAACRPQAWSAAAAVTVADALSRPQS